MYIYTAFVFSALLNGKKLGVKPPVPQKRRACFIFVVLSQYWLAEHKLGFELTMFTSFYISWFTVFKGGTENVELSDLAYEQSGIGYTPVTVAENEEAADQPTRGIFTRVDRYLTLMENWFKNIYAANSSIIKLACFSILLCLYIAYVVVACIKNFDKAVDLFAISMFALLCLVYWFIKKFFGKWIAKNIFSPIEHAIKSRWTFFKW